MGTMTTSTMIASDKRTMRTDELLSASLDIVLGNLWGEHRLDCAEMLHELQRRNELQTCQRKEAPVPKKKDKKYGKKMKPKKK